MTTVVIEPSIETNGRRVAIRLLADMTNDQLFEFCQLNDDLQIERTAEGEIVIMPPTGWETGARNIKITTQLNLWSDATAQVLQPIPRPAFFCRPAPGVPPMRRGFFALSSPD